MALSTLFDSWEQERQEEFLDFCTGVKGVKILYDSFFKEIMNPEYSPGRLNRFLSLLLGKRVTIKQVIPNDSTRIAAEGSLLVTDIVVELSLIHICLQQLQFGMAAAINIFKSVLAITLLFFANKVSNKLTDSGLF